MSELGLRRAPAGESSRSSSASPAWAASTSSSPYKAGLSNNKTGAWVEEQHEAALRDLIAAVTGARD